METLRTLNQKPFPSIDEANSLLGVLSGVTSKVTIVITHIRGLITPFITIHKPPSRPGSGAKGLSETKEAGNLYTGSE